MKYMLNRDNMSAQSVFSVPNEVVDKHIKLATATQIKVLLISLRTLNSEIDIENIASNFGIEKSEIIDALDFWAGVGIVKCERQPEKETVKPIAVARDERPSRTDVAIRGNEDENIRMILRQAQINFGRNLKTNEASTLVWLYDDMGMNVSVLLLLLQYAVGQGKCNIKFIENTGVKWLNSGVETVADAEKCISDELKRNLAWEVVRKTFGIDRAKPSEKELEFSCLWVEKYAFSPEMLKMAYDVCIDSTAKLSFPYIGKVLEKWHKNGIKTPEDINKKNEEKTNKSPSLKNAGGYDLSAFEKMLKSDD